jgi:3-oxoacyl-[acyl-carrier protein] reductase
MTKTRKVALITGGGRGIGAGIVRCLAGEGYSIAFSGVRDASAVEAFVADIESLGVEVLYAQADVGDAEARGRMLTQVRDHFGSLNLLVNNAGIAPPERKDILESSEASYETVMRTNLQGPYFLTQAAANWMIEQKSADGNFEASIINVSSISATVASVNRGEYCVSKAGMSMATQLWAARLGEYDIPVYEIQPGIIQTDMTAGAQEKYDKRIAEGLTVQSRWGFPEDVGKAVAMLARGDLPYSTGQVIMVDGGLTLPRL